MERLTERAEVDKCPGIWVKEDFANKGIYAFFNGYDEGYSAINKCADYEDLEEQGLLIRLPCKVGDTVYDLVFCDDGKCRIFEMKVCHISPFGSVRKGKRWNVYLEDDYTKAYRSFYDFDKTIFLTQTEAEEALKKMNGTEEANE